MPPAKKKKPASASQPKPAEKSRARELGGLFLLALGVFFFVCVFLESAGIVGVFFRNGIMGLLGCVGYAVPFGLAAAGLVTIISRSPVWTWKRITLYGSVAYVVVMLVHLVFLGRFDRSTFLSFMQNSYDQGMRVHAGTGALPALLLYPLTTLLGSIGTWILLVTFLLALAVIRTRLSLRKVSKDIGRGMQEHVVRPVEQWHTEQREQRASRNAKPLYWEPLPQSAADDEDVDLFGKEAFNPRDTSLVEFSELDFHTDTADVEPFSMHDEPTLHGFERVPVPKVSDFMEKEDGEEKHFTESQARPPKAQRERSKAAAPVDELLDDDQAEGKYVFPPVSLLGEAKTKKSSAAAQAECEQNARLLEETLGNFGISAKVVDITHGPAITRFEMQPAPGVKISRIINLSNDIAMNMAAAGVRIEAPIPGKNAIGIEIPNQTIGIVMLREVLDHPSFVQAQAKLSACLGQDIAGKNIITDLSKMPHVLIAGATGSGKSVCINCLIISLLYKATPQEVGMIMIDPKVVELSVYNGIPHLLSPVVTDPSKAAGALQWAVKEMTRRYQLFAQSKVRDLKRYNEVAVENGEEPLKQIVIIVDELADLMMVAAKDVEDGICRLAQMARAAGMHLIIATQRPSVDVITGVIKANIPSRIAFAVSSQIDSRTILDMGGAEKLLGRGDMLYAPSGSIKPLRVQGAFISEAEVERIVSHFKRDEDELEYNQDMLTAMERYGEDDDDEDSPDVERQRLDPLLRDAIDIVFDQNQASISMVQRRLRVGYARAARLIDQMELLGIVSVNTGSKPRQILKSRGESLALLDGDGNET